MTETALLLIAHGSRQAEANEDLVWLADQLRTGGSYCAVVASYLELAEPGIAEGGRRCVAAGARRVILVPYFLSAGIHVRRDLEGQRERLADQHAGVAFVLAEPLGRDELLIEVVRRRIAESLAHAPI
ncbi:MAG: CbiX/SirB N-terminal domain-containing protein [Gemmataceae bacterium]